MSRGRAGSRAWWRSAGGEVDRPRPTQHADGQVAQGRHEHGGCAGADLGGVLGERWCRGRGATPRWPSGRGRGRRARRRGRRPGRLIGGGTPHRRAVVNVLAEHLAPGGQPADFVFTGPEGGPMRIANFRNRIWRPATTAAALDGLRIHDLRHTAVALWIAAGASPRRSPCGPATPRSASRWTDTATSTRNPTQPCVTVLIPSSLPVKRWRKGS